MNEKNTLLKELSALHFSLIDLNLYLNTHPFDTKALALFTQYRQKYMELKEEYERMYGPLSAMNGVQGNAWKWVLEPWPWEYAANVEVR